MKKKFGHGFTFKKIFSRHGDLLLIAHNSRIPCLELFFVLLISTSGFAEDRGSSKVFDSLTGKSCKQIVQSNQGINMNISSHDVYRHVFRSHSFLNQLYELYVAVNLSKYFLAIKLDLDVNRQFEHERIYSLELVHRIIEVRVPKKSQAHKRELIKKVYTLARAMIELANGYSYLEKVDMEEVRAHELLVMSTVNFFQWFIEDVPISESIVEPFLNHSVDRIVPAITLLVDIYTEVNQDIYQVPKK